MVESKINNLLQIHFALLNFLYSSPSSTPQLFFCLYWVTFSRRLLSFSLFHEMYIQTVVITKSNDVSLAWWWVFDIAIASWDLSKKKRKVGSMRNSAWIRIYDLLCRIRTWSKPLVCSLGRSQVAAERNLIMWTENPCLEVTTRVYMRFNASHEIFNCFHDPLIVSINHLHAEWVERKSTKNYTHKFALRNCF